MFITGVFSSFSSLMMEGNIVGAIFFTGVYKIEFSKVSFSINGIVSFIFPKKIKTTLKIKPIFNAPKTPPKILFIIPKDAKSANLVSNLPIKAIVTIIIIKVAAKSC